MINPRESPAPSTPAPGAGALRIADAQTLIRPAILVHTLGLLAFFLFDGGGILGLAVFTALLLLFTISAYRQFTALGNRLAPLWAVLSFLPVIGLILFIHLNAVATSRLRSAGLKVGFLGVPKPDRDSLRTALARETGH